MNKAANFHDIFINHLAEHLQNSLYNKPRDCYQYEKLFTCFELTNPVERGVYSQERKVNIIFLFAEFLWYFSGRNDLDFIGYYAPVMKKFSMDGSNLTGTAYGPKITEQLDGIIKLLKEFPDTKRAVMQIFDSRELSVKDNIDVSCTLNLQFLLRNNKLNAIAFMRANDLYIGNVSDVFSFTMFLEYISKLLNVDTGSYYHVIGSSHIYEKNFQKAEIVVNNRQPFSFYGMQFPEMPSKDNTDDLHTVLYYEKLLRTGKIKLDTEKICSIKADKYWLDVISLFELQREIKNDEPLNTSILDSMNQTIRYLFNVKYGDRL